MANIVIHNLFKIIIKTKGNLKSLKIYGNIVFFNMLKNKIKHNYFLIIYQCKNKIVEFKMMKHAHNRYFKILDIILNILKVV